MKMSYPLKIAARTNYNTKHLHSIFVLGDNLVYHPSVSGGKNKALRGLPSPKPHDSL